MKVFLFTVESYRYAVSGKTQDEAYNYLSDYTGFDHIESAEVTEIPESEWDNPTIEVGEGEKGTIREAMDGEDCPYIIYTNDQDLF